MGINSIPISNRTAPYDPTVTANGGYTLPRYAFIPHPSLQQLSTGIVQSPTAGGITASFAAPAALQRPYPVPTTPNVYGMRLANLKSSPAGG